MKAWKKMLENKQEHLLLTALTLPQMHDGFLLPFCGSVVGSTRK
jgi:hypothetical protein